MKKILAISVLVLFSNGAMGSQDAGVVNRMKVIGAEYLGIKKPEGYLPREFWNDTETVREVLDEVVPEAETRAYRGRCRPDARFGKISREIIEGLLPKIQGYMETIGLPYPSKSEIYNSIGQIPPSYYNASWTPEMYIDWTKEERNNEWENSETFLDYVGDIIGRPLSKKAERALWLSEAK